MRKNIFNEFTKFLALIIVVGWFLNIISTNFKPAQKEITETNIDRYRIEGCTLGVVSFVQRIGFAKPTSKVIDSIIKECVVHVKNYKTLTTKKL